jgi:hypothetical protein
MLGFCIPVILFLAEYYLMDLQRVSYTYYVQYVHIYNVQQCINIYIKNNYKNSFLSISCRDFVACAADLCPRSICGPLEFAYDLCPWPVPSPCPPPPVYDPYPGLRPWPFFSLYKEQYVAIRIRVHTFLSWYNLRFLNTREPLSLFYFASQLRRHLRAAEYF